MIKILIMTGSMNVGGIEKALTEMLKVIPYDKYDVDLLLEEKEGVYLNEVPETVNIIHYPVIQNCLYRSRLLQLKEMLKRCKFISAIELLYNSALFSITKNRCRYFNWQCSRMDKLDKHYDVAIAYHNLFRFPGSYIINNVDADKKILWNHTDLEYDDVNISGFERLYSKIDCICSVSEAASRSVKNLLPGLKNKATVLHNVINSEIIEEKSAEHTVETDAAKHILLTVGRLSGEKGQNRIPDIASKLRAEVSDFIWYVVGGGSLEDELHNKIAELNLQDHVILTGNKSNPYPYMKACDIYVQTSWQEGFPMVIGEVLTFNKPCVVTDVGGTMEYFTHPDTVIKAEQNENQCIADSIAKLIKDRVLYEKIQNNLSKLKRQNYTESFDNLISKILNT